MEISILVETSSFIYTRTAPNINSTFDSRFHPGCYSTTDTSDNPSITSGLVLDADATKNLYPLQCRLVQILLVYFRVELRTLYTRPLLKDKFSTTANYYQQRHHHDRLLNLQLGNIFSMTMTMDYRMHHHRRCRYVTSVSISDGPSFDPSSFLIICPIDVRSFDPIHGPSNYPSLSRGSICILII